jgi:hypothetical protein
VPVSGSRQPKPRSNNELVLAGFGLGFAIFSWILNPILLASLLGAGLSAWALIRTRRGAANRNRRIAGGLATAGLIIGALSLMISAAILLVRI